MKERRFSKLTPNTKLIKRKGRLYIVSKNSNID
jgi:ribosomal protein L36